MSWQSGLWQESGAMQCHKFLGEAAEVPKIRSLCMKNFKQQQHHLIEFKYASSRQLKLLLIHLFRSYLTVKSSPLKP